MATDIRALFKKSRQQRRISHPYAKYNTLSQLICAACNQRIQSEALWDKHILSASHKQNVKESIAAGQRKAKRGIAGREFDENEEQDRGNKRPKLEEDHEEEEIKDGEIPSNPSLVPTDGVFDTGSENATKTAQSSEEVVQPSPLAPNSSSSAMFESLPSDFFDSGKAPQKTIDEFEWARFQAEIAETSRLVAKEDDFDEEDAARRGVEDEFYELETLEKRLARLRKRRQEIKEMEKERTGQDRSVNGNESMQVEIDDEEEESEEDSWWS